MSGDHHPQAPVDSAEVAQYEGTASEERSRFNRSTDLDRRLDQAWERKEADYAHALTHRTNPSRLNDKGTPVYDPPEWTVEHMAGGVFGETPSFDVRDIPDASARDAITRFYTLVGAGRFFDYRDPASGSTEEEREAVDAFVASVLDTCEQLTESQRQAMIDWGHWTSALRFGNEMKDAVNVSAQQALNTVFFLAGLPIASEAHTLRLQKIKGLMSDQELFAAYQAAIPEAESTATEAIEALKWEGILDEYGQPRTEPLPDRTTQRRDGEPYHPEVHAEWTNWRPGADDWGTMPEPTPPLFKSGYFGGTLWLCPPGEMHPKQEPETRFDPFNPKLISDYVGECDQHIPITEDSMGLEIGLQVSGVALRYDERSAALQYTDRDPRGIFWEEMDDRSEGSLWDDIARLCCFERGDAAIPARFRGQARSDSRNALQFRNSCDAFVADYLDKLPLWDGQPRVDGLLETIFDLETTSQDEIIMAQLAGRSILLGAVLRTAEPGAKLDEIAVLIGPQGCGKSLFCAALVPGFRRSEWFSDELVLRTSGQHRDQAQALMGRVIVECAEMAGMSRADMDGLKAFLARQVDRVRLPYDRLITNLPRRCVIIGTSNDDQVLPNDPTGLRRFLPVRIAGIGPRNVLDVLEQERDQLWAEARHRVENNNERPILDNETREVQRRLTEMYRRADEIVEELVGEYAEANPYKVSLHEVVSHVADKTENLRLQGLEGRVKYALRKLGYSAGGRERTGDSRQRFWTRALPSPTSSRPKDEF